MRIAELTLIHARIPLKREIRHASHARSENDTLLLRCRLNEGMVGWGEGLPRPYVTGETIDSAWEHLHAADWQSQLAESVDSLADMVSMCERFRFNPPPNQRDCFGNAARCAVELAVLDAFTRSFDVPLAAAIELVPNTEPIRLSVDSVRYSAVMTAMSSWKQRVSAWKYRLYGFKQCKAKVGIAGEDDAESLKRVRGILGRGVDLRVDANEAWRVDELESKIAQLAPFAISAVEQPVSHADVKELQKLRPRLAMPIMLDESLCSLSDAELAIELGLCDLFNIRLSKCGGILPSLKMASLAHDHGLGYQLGCQVGETGILSAAGRQFATSVAGIRYLEGSYDRHLVREPLTTTDMTFGFGGVASKLKGPGLGVEIDETAVRRVTVRESRMAFH